VAWLKDRVEDAPLGREDGDRRLIAETRKSGAHPIIEFNRLEVIEYPSQVTCFQNFRRNLRQILTDPWNIAKMEGGTAILKVIWIKRHVYKYYVKSIQ
jgi:hypothetical protein